ncbi:hypothetical protein ACU8KH_05467 [Lachancea thermotolerans]
MLYRTWGSRLLELTLLLDFTINASQGLVIGGTSSPTLKQDKINLLPFFRPLNKNWGDQFRPSFDIPYYQYFESKLVHEYPNTALRVHIKLSALFVDGFSKMYGKFNFKDLK